jgi:transcriptional regulator with XRE-family HTH domain
MQKNEKNEFTKRLLTALKNIGYQVNNISGITIEINKLFGEKSITSHAVRKWLTGQSLPIHSRLIRLADWLGVSPAWLRFGEGEMYKLTDQNESSARLTGDVNFQILIAKINSLSKDELHIVENQIDLLIKIKKL